MRMGGRKMTTGETIKFYRKKFNLSQEELGQKLLVSRQTISLWEKDQTIPTIDNLVRLREIFNISVDELLGYKSNDPHTQASVENYQFYYSEDECLEIYKFLRNTIIRRTIVFSLLCLFLFLFFIADSAPDILSGLIIGAFIMGNISNVKALKNVRIKSKKYFKRVSENLYTYQIFNDFFKIEIIKDNETVKSLKVHYTDIEKIQDTGKYLLINVWGQLFILKKENLTADCAFYLYMKNNPQKVLKRKKADKLQLISNALFILSLLSIPGFLLLISWVSSINNLFLANTWLCFLFTPFSIASIVFGFFLKSKNYKYRKNIIAGIIITLILCIYGSFTFIFSDVYDHSDKPVIRVEQLVGIDVPEYKQINTQDWTKGEQDVSRGYINYTSDIYFDNALAKGFEKSLKTDNRWITSIPNNLIGITSPFSDYKMYDYALIYNIETGEYNTLPKVDGTYSFINIFFNSEQSKMKIVEYEMKYTKN